MKLFIALAFSCLLSLVLASKLYAVGLYDANYENNLLKIPLIKVGDVVYEVTMIRADSAELANIGCAEFCFRLASAREVSANPASTYSQFDSSTGLATLEKLWFQEESYTIVLRYLGILNGGQYFSLTEADRIRGLQEYLNIAQSQDLEWQKYQDEIGKVKQYFRSYPVLLNTNKEWFSSLQIDPDLFSTRRDYFDIDEKLFGGVGFGSSANLHSGDQLIFYSYWVPQKPSSGAAFAVKYTDNIPIFVDYLPIEGATNSWPLIGADGNITTVFVGVDEGKISVKKKSTSPTYFYDVARRVWSKTEFLTASHHSNLFDYDGDGFEDIFAQSWQDTNFILRNTGSSFERIQLGENKYPYTHAMAIAPIGFKSDSTFDLIITDGRAAPEFNIAPERNFIATLASDLKKVVALRELPLPYFERITYDGIKQIVEDWEGGVGLSHDVAAKAIDIDYDGDLDIVISSMIWSESHPYNVLQILINYDGEYVDETDDRLYNWLLVGNGMHRVDFLDVNEDGFVDILVSDHALPFNFHNSTVNTAYLSGSRVLLNDGEGHFVVVIHQQVNNEGLYLQSHIPSLDLSGELKWTVVNAGYSGNNPGSKLEIITRKLNLALSTGPNGIDPRIYGAAGFNEFYYLRNNGDVRQAIKDGMYISGLHHYLASGKAEGRKPNAH
jgi:hypothetical protein